jgi:hypothetical protein
MAGRGNSSVSAAESRMSRGHWSGTSQGAIRSSSRMITFAVFIHVFYYGLVFD